MFDVLVCVCWTCGKLLKLGGVLLLGWLFMVAVFTWSVVASKTERSCDRTGFCTFAFVVRLWILLIFGFAIGMGVRLLL